MKVSEGIVDNFFKLGCTIYVHSYIQKQNYLQFSELSLLIVNSDNQFCSTGISVDFNSTTSSYFDGGVTDNYTPFAGLGVVYVGSS